MDEVSCMESNDVHAQNLASVLAVDHLGHALSLLLSQSLQAKDISVCPYALLIYARLAGKAPGVSQTSPAWPKERSKQGAFGALAQCRRFAEEVLLPMVFP